MSDGGAQSIDEGCHRSSGGVVVGLDGSANAEHALRWAADKADVLGPITPVVVYELPDQDILGRGRAQDPVAHRESAEERLHRAVDAVDPELRARGKAIEAHPGRGLLDAAADADLLVVGTRGQSGLASSLLGSVSAYCATHADVPVVIVPAGCPTDRALEQIVVGVDGSRHADAALRWAIEHVAPGGQVRAVGAMPIWGAPETDGRPVEQHFGDVVEAAIERVMGEVTLTEGDDREVVITTSPRDARVVLREVADDGADLLVIGRRGRSRISFLVVGSVAAALSHHPTVPTVVIPPVAPPADAEPSSESNDESNSQPNDQHPEG